MDANGHRFWLLASADDFALGAGAAWGDGCLRLAGAAAAFETAAPRAEALAMADLPPVTTDAHGTWAWFDPAAGEDDEAGLIVAEGAARGPATILRVPGSFYRPIAMNAYDRAPKGKAADKKGEAADQVVEVVKSLELDYETVWGSMVKQTLRRVNPGFNEEYHGYSSFAEMLEDLRDQKVIELDFDEERGNFIVRTPRG